MNPRVAPMPPKKPDVIASQGIQACATRAAIKIDATVDTTILFKVSVLLVLII